MRFTQLAPDLLIVELGTIAKAVEKTLDKSKHNLRKEKIVTPISEQLNRTKLKMVELVEELSSFFKLILLTLVEALYIYIFIRVHQPFDGYREHSSFCPMKIAILTIGFSLMFLNALIVIAFVMTQTLAIIRGLKSTFRDKGPAPGESQVIWGPPNKVQPNSLIAGSVGSSKVNITITVVGGSKDSVIVPKKPSASTREIPLAPLA